MFGYDHFVSCGRSLTRLIQIGAAAWWYNWKQDSFDELAGSLIAGRKSIAAMFCAFSWY